MGRFVLYFPAVVATMLEVAVTRRGRPEGKRAEGLLAFIDNERALTDATLADVGDEALQLTRFYDTGSHDPASAASVHDEFRARVDFLFVQGRCWEFGFCKYALRVLGRSYAVVHDGAPRIIGGGVSVEAQARCLQRLRCWVFLATTTIATEFPKWDVTQAMQVFRLAAGHGASGGARDAAVRRLATVFGLCAEKLHAQLGRVYPVAFNLQAISKGLPDVEAWRQAVLKISARPSSFGDVSELRQVLVRALAWQGCSTSKVEQSFSRLDPIRGGRAPPTDLLIPGVS